MRIYLNRFLIFALTLLSLMNFFLTPNSTVAYNTKNLTQMNTVAKK
jgi:hypothetical protein